jgi:hypothetical protein
MMQQCVQKEASQLLCEAVQARVEDGNTDEEWQDNEGCPLLLIAGGTLVKVKTFLAMGHAWASE